MADQPKKDFEFRYRGRPESMQAYVEYVSTLTRICGAMTTNHHFAAGVATMVRRWRYRLVTLRQAGWHRVAEGKKKFAYARNCRPCGVKISVNDKTWPAGSGPQACGLRICPFCYGRAVADLWLLTEQVVAARPHGYRLASYILVSDNRETDTLPDDVELMRHDFTHRLLPQHQRAQAAIRKRLGRGVAGGVSSYSLGVVRGRWIARHGWLGLVPPDWDPGDVAGKVICVNPTNASARSLAAMVAKTFHYPPGWLSGDAKATVLMLDRLQGQRTLVRFGAFHGNSDT
jgi:hypothetical protein